jgi:PAS domain S-box-containing protein
MPSGERRAPGAIDPAPDVNAELSSVNAVFTLSLILTQASSPVQLIRLVTTAIPSIARCQRVLAWHPFSAGEYYERAPDGIGDALASHTEPGQLDIGDSASCWAFPLGSRRAGEPVFLVLLGGDTLTAEEIFLLSVLAQLCGTVIAKLELIAAERMNARRIAELSQADRDRDVAQARAAELTASEARQRAVLEAALDAVVSADQDARVTYVNSAFEHIFGYQAAEVIGRELGELIVPPPLREAHRQGFARYLATGERRILDQRLELTAMRADGSVFPAEVTVTRTGPAAEPAFTGYIRDITERQRAEQDLMASRARLVAASDTARRRVTRDLHDGAQQRFVTTLINLQLAEQKWDSAPEQARELVSRALRDARHGLQDLRELVAGIHPELLTQRGLAAAIGALAARLPVPVELDVPAMRLPAPVEASVYFFCAEALTNVVRHARATSAQVRVDISADQCAVEVRDDGIGGARPRSEDSGLTGLRDRIGALRGTVDIVSPAAGGTLLRATIPLRPAGGPDERTFVP